MMQTDSLENFLNKVRTAQRTKTKEVRISIDEASEIVTAIAQLLNIETTLQKQLLEAQKITSIQIGGTFK